MNPVSTTPLLTSFPASAAVHNVRTGYRVSIHELDELVQAQCAELAALNLSERSRLVIGKAEGIEVLTSLFAAWSAGHPVVLVNPGLAPEERRNVCAKTKAAAWLDGNGIEILQKGSSSLSPHIATPLGPDEPALVLMTSGTTGRPKGIVLTLRALEARLHLNLAHIGASPSLSSSLCVLPLFFGHGLIGNCLTPLCAGGTLHLLPSPTMQEIGDVSALIDREDISFMSSVPTFWKAALRFSPAPNRPLARIHVGSAPLGLDLWRDIAGWCGTDEVYNMFGMSETANWISGGALSDQGARDGFVGSAWGGRLAVLNEAGEPAEAGTGEVLVHSPSLMQSYLDAPEENAAAHLGPWFRTGDVGELGPDGLTLVGRIKTEINRGGIKILCEEIDMLLERHPSVAEACTFGVPDPAAGEAVAIAVVLEPDTDKTAGALQAWCAERVRREAVPAVIHIVDAIPRNDRGKVVRSEVRTWLDAAGEDKPAIT